MKLHKLLTATTIERQVEDIYNEALKKAFPSIKLEYPFACDGYCEFEASGKTHRLLIEYKFDEDFSSKATRSKVLVQVLAYMKRLEDTGRPLPTVVLVADKNECFVLHANDLVKWLSFEGVKWDAAPSGMADANPDLVLAFAEDETRNAFVFDINEDFDFDDAAQKIESLSTNTVRLVRITEHNVDKVFGLFEKKIILEKKMSSNDMVALFFNVITGSEDVYLHPTKKNVLVCNGKEMRVDSGKLKAFCSHFATTCSPKEKARLASISDRLLEDTSRRRKGAFYTPTAFVDYSHKMIEKKLGESWKDDYVVWDCACGTKNLTRDYRFKELYCSTLEDAELDISKKYNPEATAFQFDFLNDGLKRVSQGGKVPDGLMDALEGNKKIVFYINPPYAAGTGLHNGDHLVGVNRTQTYLDMKSDKVGGRSSNLYTQFIYRISKIQRDFKLANCTLAIFCPPSFLTCRGYKEFRHYALENFEWKSGMLFDSMHFADVAFGAIMFSIWKNGKTAFQITTDVVDDANDGLEVIGNKELYNLDNSNALNIWHREKNKKPIPWPTLKNALVISTFDNKFDEDAIGYLYAHGNNIFQAAPRTAIFSAPFLDNVGGAIFESNFTKCMAAFAARLVSYKDAYNRFDEFMAPDTSNTKWQQFSDDSIVYALFHGKSLQSSLHQIDYHEKKWDINNNFFWCDPKKVAEWANASNVDEIYADASTMPERFVCQKLKSIKLSSEAQAVLDKANELLEKSMKFRKLFNDERPEVQILNADAGWYQLKQMLKVYMLAELKDFNALYKNLSDKMRPLVYELGFLRK